MFVCDGERVSLWCKVFYLSTCLSVEIWEVIWGAYQRFRCMAYCHDTALLKIEAIPVMWIQLCRTYPLWNPCELFFSVLFCLKKKSFLLKVVKYISTVLGNIPYSVQVLNLCETSVQVLMITALQLSNPLIIEALHTSGLYPTLICVSDFTHLNGPIEAIRVLMYISVCCITIESFGKRHVACCSVKYSQCVARTIAAALMEPNLAYL